MLIPSLDGTVAGREVRMLDIGPMGTRVEHDQPLVGNAPLTLRFHWDEEPIEIECDIVRSDDHPHDPRERINIFRSGLHFLPPSPAVAARLRRMLDFLEQREELERLRTLVEASKLINSSIDADGLFASILAVARKELQVERGTLYFVDEKAGEIWAKIAGDLEGREIRLPIGTGIAGNVAATGAPVLLHDAYEDSRFDRSLDASSGFRTRSMLCVPIQNRDRRVVGVLQLLNKTRGSFGPGDLRFLDSISEHMAIAMENATLHRDLLEKQRMERELQLGREIQGALLPKPPSDIAGIGLSASSIPCYEVGGDYYDFLELPGGDLGLVIADVSGKGVGAALIMSSVQAALRVAAPIESDLAMLVTRLNALIYRGTGGRKYVTFFFGRYTPSTGVLRFVNAGHNPPLVIDGETLEKLDSTGRPIGLLPDSRFAERTCTIPPGGTLVLYTDGLNEACNPEDEEFGMERLEAVALAAARTSLDAAAAAILDAIASFEREARATDDKTLVLVRRADGRR